MKKTVVLVMLASALTLAGCASSEKSSAPIASQTDSKKQTQAVVFDIDGTLTPHSLSIFEARPDAANAVRIFAERGYKIIYLSARKPWFQAGIRDWLTKNNFPEGNLQLLQPTDPKEEHDYPDVFKRRVLEDFSKHGWRVMYAYGDSHTDFVAYELANIPHFFGLIREGEAKCQPDHWQLCLKGGWTGHLEFLRDSVPRVPTN